MSPVLRRGFLFAAVVASLIVLSTALGSAVLARLVRRVSSRRSEPAPESLLSIAIASVASALILRFAKTVHGWAESRGLPPEAGLVALVLVSCAAAAVAVALFYAPSRGRWRGIVLGAWCGVASLAWYTAVADRLFLATYPPRLYMLTCSGIALVILVGSEGLVPRARRTWRRLAVAFIVAVGIVLPVAAVASHALQLREAAVEDRAPTRKEMVNVVVLMIDTLRADHTGIGGYAPDTTPTLRALLGKRSTAFTNAIAASASTIPSIKALFTSQPGSHFDNVLFGSLPPRAWTMARAFRRAGYRTAAFTANGLIDGGFRNGFQEFWAMGGHTFFRRSFLLSEILCGARPLAQFKRTDWLRLHKETGPTLAALGERWIASHRDEPFFLYLHLVDPHWPYYDRGYGLLSRELRGLPGRLSHVTLMQRRKGDPRNATFRAMPQLRELVARYDEEIRLADEAIGQFLRALDENGVGDSTLVVIVADHGEEFFEHDGFGHGHDVYEEQIHVPLVFRWPDRPEFRGMPQRVSEPVSLMDILPTLSDYLDLPAPRQRLLGRSLRPMLEGVPGRFFRPVISEAKVPGAWRAAYRRGRWKVRFAAKTRASLLEPANAEVYYLETDRGEQRPLPQESVDVAELVRDAGAHLDSVLGPPKGRLP